MQKKNKLLLQRLWNILQLQRTGWKKWFPLDFVDQLLTKIQRRIETFPRLQT